MLHLKSNIITTGKQLHTLSFSVNYSFDLLIAQLCDFIYITVSVVCRAIVRKPCWGVFAVVAACSGLYVVCAGNSSGTPEVEFFCKFTKTLIYR